MLNLSRQEMIDELMEGIAFEEDAMIDSALANYARMSDEEIRKEYNEIMGN